MAAGRIIVPNYMPALDLNGNPLGGAKLYFYENGTTTLKTTYTSSALSVAHPNPVIANSAGVFPSIFADTTAVFSVSIRDANDVPISGLRDNDDVMTSVVYGTDIIADSAAALAAAQAAVVVAEAARDAALVGETNAETAEVNAELAEVNAEAAAAAAAASATTALNAQTQAELAAMVSGNTIYVTMPTAPFTGVPSPFLYSTSAGVSVYTHNGVTATQVGWLGQVYFVSVAAMLAFAGTLGPVGTIIRAGRYRYQAVSSGAHVTSAGGTGLIVLPGEDGYDIEAFGADMTGVASANSILTAASAVCVTANEPLVVKGGTLLVNANLTLACAITVKKGGLFNNTSGTLTLNGEFRAGLHSVFTVTGNGPTWGPNSIDFIRPEWFGAKSRGSSSAQFDSYTGISLALAASARGTSGFTYLVQLSQGIYDLGTTLSWPVAGANTLRGMGNGITQLRGMDLGGGYPNALITMVTGTADSRVLDIAFFGGSTRQVNYGITGAEMKHTHVLGCSFAGFIIAGINSAEWDNVFARTDFSNCGVGIWTSRNGNNNDITIDTCTFVACDVGVAFGAGANQGMSHCQFQAALTAPFTKTHIYVQGVTGFSGHKLYFESQAPVGMAGMAFTTPEAVRVFADIIFNNSPYYTDLIGTVTTTLAQASTSSGTVGTLSACNFASPTYYTAGAGGTGYTAGAVTLTATNGTGSGASGTCTVSGSSVSSVTASVGGTDFQTGDRVLIDQGGNVTASAIVTATTTNNAILTLMIGGNAAIYPGHVRSLTVDSCNVGNAYLVLYDDEAICNPRRIAFRQCVKASGLYDYQIIGSNTTTVKAPLRNILQDNLAYIAGSGLDNGITNYFPTTLAFTPSTSAIVRSGGRYQGLPNFRITLNAAQQTSDALSGSFTVSSSGATNGDLAGRRIYFSVGKAESAANVKLRLTLQVVSGTSTITRQNYDTSTVFTKASGVGREEVSIVVPSAGATVNWTAQVIASTAASQFVEFFGMVIAPVGTPIDSFPRWTHERPLTGSATWDPASLVDGATTSTTVSVIGARLGDAASVSYSASLQGIAATAYVSAANVVTIVLNNETGGTIDLASGTWRVAVDMTT